MKTPKNRNGKPARPAGPWGRPGGAQSASTAAITSLRTEPGLPILITGGAGFIGTNAAHHFLEAGRRVIVYDNLSRPGVERNVSWLRKTHGDGVQIEVGDVLDFKRLRRLVRQVGQIFHFAAQVAVTTSLADPFLDFEVNARGTLNLLEAIRRAPQHPSVLFTSTNKVYGDLKDVGLEAEKTRYVPQAHDLRGRGFDEGRPLDFHSPYGCSKGAAEQYVLDYARTFGIPGVVFRMSCIYGPHQYGNEDQGWMAHFLIRALEGREITVYGDGRQVRDILFIEDLVGAFLAAQTHLGKVAGRAFNMGGGPENTISLLELLDAIRELQGTPPPVRFEDWRPADQQYYVSDTRSFTAATGWTPKIGVPQGLQHLYGWLRDTRSSEVVPVLVRPSPAARAANGFHRPRVLAKLAAPSSELKGRQARSKRLWKLGAAEPLDLSEKIIKFP